MGDWFSGITPGDLLRRIRGRGNSTTEDQEDAVQDVLLRVLETARRGRPPPAPRSPDAYLVRAVHNRLTSMQRARWREVAGYADEAPGAADELTPEDIHDARERADLFGLLANALAGKPATAGDEHVALIFAELQARLCEELTDRHWILLRLRVLEGVGVAECATLLGVSLGTAHNWTHKALDIVRGALGQCGVEPGALAYDEESARQ